MEEKVRFRYNECSDVVIDPISKKKYIIKLMNAIVIVIARNDVFLY
jgi:hypothetical protein